MMRSRSGRCRAAISAERMRRFAELAVAGELTYEEILDDDQDWFGRQNLRASKDTITRAKRNFQVFGDAAYKRRRVCRMSLDCRHRSALVEALAKDPRTMTRDKLQRVCFCVIY